MTNGLIPPGAVRAGSRGLIAGVIGIALLAAIVIGGWQANWWFASHNATRQNNLIQSGVSNQESQESQLVSNIGTIGTITVQMDSVSGQELADLHAERLGIARKACLNAAQLTAIPPEEASWVSQNCLAGAVSPTSPLEK